MKTRWIVPLLSLTWLATLACVGLVTSPEHADGANELGATAGPPDPAGPTDPAPTDPDDPGPGGDPTNSGCVSDRVEVPEGQSCTCQFDSCDASSLSCDCDLACYGDADCLIGTDPAGNPTTSDGFLGNCALSCTPEDDVTTEMSCSASDCQVEPNTMEINPEAEVAPPASTGFEAERAVEDVSVLFVVDNSGSMHDDQMAAACAMDSFFGTASANGASYETGVLTTDMHGTLGTGATYNLAGQYVGPPGLAGLAGTCTTTVPCGSCTDPVLGQDVCRFDDSGEMVASDAVGSEELLKQLIVQGDRGSPSEGSLEQAFQFFAEQERRGTFDLNAAKEVVVISDEEADADAWLCPFDTVDRNTTGIPDFSPPTPTNTLASCKQDLIDFYVYYFTTRNVIVHGLLYTADCVSSSTEEVAQIQAAVIDATGGHADSICHCDDFDSFFEAVGGSTSTLSTELCFPGSLPDPATIEVVYADTGEVVPRSQTDGWSIDPNLNCIVMNGSWQDVFGTFRIEYVDPDAPPLPPQDPVACLPPGVDPLLDTIRVFCNGVEVPESAIDGYTFDPANDCFEFHGSYQNVDGSTCTLEYL